MKLHWLLVCQLLKHAHICNFFQQALWCLRVFSWKNAPAAGHLTLLRVWTHQMFFLFILFGCLKSSCSTAVCRYSVYLHFSHQALYSFCVFGWKEHSSCWLLDPADRLNSSGTLSFFFCWLLFGGQLCYFFFSSLVFRFHSKGCSCFFPWRVCISPFSLVVYGRWQLFQKTEQ